MKELLNQEKSIYIQIAEMIENDILRDVIMEEERVPSTNELAKLYTINPATAAKGINLLVDNGILYKTCDLFFEAELEDNATMVLQKDEVSDIKKVPVNSIEDVNHIPLAFKSASEILKVWVKSVK